MSHATVALSPATQLLMNALMPAMAAGAAGFAVTAGAVMAARKLQCDYEHAKTEFEERCRQDEAAMLAENSRQAVMSSAGASFGALIEAGGENTTLTFLQRAVAELEERAKAAGLPAPDEALATLATQLESAPVSESLKQYFGLSDEVDAAIEALARGSGEYAGVFAAIRAEIQSPILGGSRHEKLRDQFEDQLAKLEAIERNASVVRQGADNLKSRVRREITEQSERQIRDIRVRQHRRELTAEAFALIRAVMQGSDDVDERGRATALLGQLGATFQGGAPPTVSELEALLAKARSLFDKCEKRLDEAVAQAFVAESVKDVLLNMGYHVSEVPPEVATSDPGCMVSIDNDSGVVVSLAGDGRMVTEMVAFSLDGRNPDEVAEKRVCAIVDDIMAGLRDRQIPMIDKTRKKLRPGHQLRLVKKTRQHELIAASDAKARAIE